MKFARRAEGIKSARTIFKKAREDPRSKFQIYVAAALMEYYCSKDQNIAFRIFELGLKKFPEDPDFILCYLDYLSHLNGRLIEQNFNPRPFHLQIQHSSISTLSFKILLLATWSIALSCAAG